MRGGNRRDATPSLFVSAAATARSRVSALPSRSLFLFQRFHPLNFPKGRRAKANAGFSPPSFVSMVCYLDFLSRCRSGMWSLPPRVPLSLIAVVAISLPDTLTQTAEGALGNKGKASGSNRTASPISARGGNFFC